MEYYHAEHFKWFGVGLVFVILPCLCYGVFYLFKSDHDTGCFPDLDRFIWVKTLLCVCHPFRPAFKRLQEFFVYLDKMSCADATNSDSNAEDGDDAHIQFEILVYVFLESLSESAPQFLIQLYVINVQDEPATVIQIISIPVSLLSVAWAFATVDDALLRMNNSDRNGDTLKAKYKFAFFVTQVFLLSSRLVAICYFTVSFQRWVMLALVYHTYLLAIGDTIWHCMKSHTCEIWRPFVFFIFAGVFNSLRDDGVIQNIGESRKYMRRRQLICYVLFILENFVMILLYYFSQPNNWYSWPITVSVCLLGVLGAVIRVKLYHPYIKT